MDPGQFFIDADEYRNAIGSKNETGSDGDFGPSSGDEIQIISRGSVSGRDLLFKHGEKMVDTIRMYVEDCKTDMSLKKLESKYHDLHKVLRYVEKNNLFDSDNNDSGSDNNTVIRRNTYGSLHPNSESFRPNSESFRPTSEENVPKNTKNKPISNSEIDKDVEDYFKTVISDDEENEFDAPDLGSRTTHMQKSSATRINPIIGSVSLSSDEDEEMIKRTEGMFDENTSRRSTQSTGDKFNAYEIDDDFIRNTLHDAREEMFSMRDFQYEETSYRRGNEVDSYRRSMNQHRQHRHTTDGDDDEDFLFEEFSKTYADFDDDDMNYLKRDPEFQLKNNKRKNMNKITEVVVNPLKIIPWSRAVLHVVYGFRTTYSYPDLDVQTD